MSHANLGLVPQWQFSADPRINPFINSHVAMPDGWTQAYTVQPYGSSMTPIQVPIPSPLYGASNPSPLYGANNLGYLMIDRERSQLSGVGGWAWEHRKGLALGVVALFGIGLLGGLSAILK